MFLKKVRNLRRTLALRLTIWYAAIFTVSSVLSFALVYFLIVSFLQQRIDTELQEDLAEFASLLREGGLPRIRAQIAEDTVGDEAREMFFRLWAPGGRQVMASHLASWRGLDVPQQALRQLGGDQALILQTIAVPHRRHGVRTIYGTIGPELVLEIGQSMEEEERFLEVLLQGFFITFAAILVIVSPIGWFMARRALRGVEKVTETATEIAHGALDRRVTIESKSDELERLAQAFNTMLDRIQALIVAMREMTDNLAHDLRSPLARIRAAAEMSLTGADAGAARRSGAANTIEECDRLLNIINTTLDIAEAESGAAKLKLDSVDLVAVVVDACELFQTVAEDRRVAIRTHFPSQCRIQGDLQRLQRVVANLLDNALKYTPVGGQVEIALADNGQVVRLAFEDTGIGMSADELARIFQRFYRSDRSRSLEGNGLGLNLARAFVRAHGGEISVASTLGKGSVFTVTLGRTSRGQLSEAGPRAPSQIDRRVADG